MSKLAFEKTKPQAREYQIIVYGKLESSWSEWFSGLTLATVADQHGVLTTCLTGSLPESCYQC